MQTELDQPQRAQRVRFQQPVRVVPIGGAPRAYRLQATNLSRDGIFLTMQRPLDLGTRVALSLEAGGRVLPFAQGEVVWNRGPDGAQEQPPTGFGVRFTDFLHPRADEMVNYLVAALEKGAPLQPAPAQPWWRSAGAMVVGASGLALAAAVGVVLVMVMLPHRPGGAAPSAPESEAPETVVEAPVVGASPVGERAASAKSVEAQGAAASPGVERTAFAQPVEAPVAGGAHVEERSAFAQPEEAPAAGAAPVEERTASATVAREVVPSRKASLAGIGEETVRPERSRRATGASSRGATPLTTDGSAPQAEKGSAPRSRGSTTLALNGYPLVPSPSRDPDSTDLRPAENSIALVVPPAVNAPVATPGVAAASAPPPQERGVEATGPEAHPPHATATAPLAADASPPADSARAHLPAAKSKAAHTISLPSGAVRRLTWELARGELRIEPHLEAGATLTRIFLLTGPPRVVFDLAGPPPSRSYAVKVKGGSLEQVRLGRQGQATRVVVDLAHAPSTLAQAGGAAILSF